MKKFLFTTIIFLLFFSCTKKEENQISLWVFFPDSSITYTGGFENSNYTIITEQFSKDIVVQKIETTGTTVTKAIKITDSSATVVFLGEEINEYKEDMNNMERVILKLPLEKGNSWESDENLFTIEDSDGNILVVSRKFEGGEITTTYQSGTGMINETFSSDGFSRVSEIVSKKP